MGRTQRRIAARQQHGRSARVPQQDAQALLATALDAHRAGQLATADGLYRRILGLHPHHADCLHLSGVVAHQQQRHDDAVALIGRAIALDPAVPAYRVNLGNALAAHGLLDDAVASYRAALVLAPGLVEAHVNLGSALLMQGKAGAASDSFRQALALQPDMAQAHVNLGNALLEDGAPEDAIRCFGRALALAPQDPDACFSLGNALVRQDRHADAIDCYNTALAARPAYPEALNNLGVSLRELARPDEALACYISALALRPDYADAHNNMGTALRDQDRPLDAIASYRAALRLVPDYAEAHYNLGTTLMEQFRQDEAAASLDRALQLREDFPEAQHNLGNVLREQGRLIEAEACCRRALALRPDLAEAHNNLGIVLRDQDRANEALACFATAIRLKPTLAEAHNNVGTALRHAGSPAEAVASFNRALALRPDFAEAHSNLGMALLALGRFEAGWTHYEWRWKTAHLSAAGRGFTQPQWRGEPACGRTLLIHAEQGFGDTLQFCRYAILAASRGLRVILEVPRPLLRLLNSLDGVAQLVARGEPLPAFDLHCPMLSLPSALGTTVGTIPDAPGYLRADPDDATRWADRLDAMPARGLRVGLSWAGNPRRHSPALAAVDRRRSLPFERLAPILALPGLQLFSLQKDGPPAALDAPLTDHMGEMADFADTAALVAQLDLVISVDTAVAHLAGALGTPVWVLDRFDSCWRWLTDRSDSPWYPSMRLYRQATAGDWDQVLADVVRDLGVLARDRAAIRND